MSSRLSAGRPPRHTDGATVFEWLSEAGLAQAPKAALEGGPYSVVVLECDGGDTGIWAVPDSAISEALRAALDAPWTPTFADEELAWPGQLWLLALCGEGTRALYDWQGPVLGIDPEALVAAHRGWDAYATDAAALEGATVTRCYHARHAH
jgi:hypothetical protein